MVGCSDCALSCKTCAFEYLFSGSSSDMLILANPLIFQPHKCPQYKLPAVLKTARDHSSSPCGQLPNCTQSCASLWFHMSLCTQTNSSGHSGWKQGPKDMPVPSCVQAPALMYRVWADTKIAEGSLWKFRDCPGARSSPNRSQQGSEAFGAACDPAVGTRLMSTSAVGCSASWSPQQRSPPSFLGVLQFIQSK